MKEHKGLQVASVLVINAAAAFIYAMVVYCVLMIIGAMTNFSPLWHTCAVSFVWIFIVLLVIRFSITSFSDVKDILVEGKD